MGEDREDAVAALDDDEEFDRWMLHYQRKMQMQSKPKGQAGMRISNEQYLSKFAKTVGGEED